MVIGYARSSGDEDNLAQQIAALRAAGCETIFTDEGVSALAIERDGLSQALGAVGQGDVLVVEQLDRLGRSLGFVIDLIGKLQRDGAGFRSLTEGLDTTNADGPLIARVMGALTQVERSLIREAGRPEFSAASVGGGLSDVEPELRR